MCVYTSIKAYIYIYIWVLVLYICIYIVCMWLCARYIIMMIDFYET